MRGAISSRTDENRMKDAEHIGVVTGLSDLVNFLGALRFRTKERIAGDSKIVAALFGHIESLPARLQAEFDWIVEKAFPYVNIVKIPPGCLQGNRFRPDGMPRLSFPRSAGRRIVYGNGVHKRFHQEFFSYLEPDEFVFFDNGLSSYADHPSDIETEFAAHDIPFPSLACYSLSPPLPAPEYLSSIRSHYLGRQDYVAIYDALRAVVCETPETGWLPSHVVIGTSLFRTKRITWEEERSIYMKLIRRLQDAQDGGILYKAHPRASDRPLITKADGIDVLDSSVPVEVFVKPGSKGAVYSISSTALFTLNKYFGWTAHRIETPAARTVLNQSPHLRLVESILPTMREEM